VEGKVLTEIIQVEIFFQMAQLDSLILIAEWSAYQEMGDIFEGELSQYRSV
jgi:hypothetical protein